MEYATSVLSRPAQAVLSLEDAKRELDVTSAEDDLLITDHINSAIDWIEHYTGRYLFPATLQMAYDAFPAIIRLPTVPVLSVTSVTVDGVAIAGSRVVPGNPYSVLAPIGQPWPYTANGFGSSIIVFEAGYPTGDCPPGLVAAVKALVGIYFDKPIGVELAQQQTALERMLSTYRIRNL